MHADFQPYNADAENPALRQFKSYFCLDEQLQLAAQAVGPGCADVLFVDSTHGTNMFGMQLQTIATQVKPAGSSGAGQPVALGFGLATVTPDAQREKQTGSEYATEGFLSCYEQVRPSAASNRICAVLARREFVCAGMLHRHLAFSSNVHLSESRFASH